MINPEFLTFLCCPETHQKIALADTSMVDKLNQQISAGQCTNRAGKTVNEKIDGALVRSDNKFLYPIRNDIPVLLIDQAIPLPA